MTTAVIYARISKDIAHEHLGVDRQQRLCEELAKRRGLKLVGQPLVDNDVSAYRSKRRPAFEALVDILKASEAQAVVVYHADRLYRRMGDLERLVEIVEATGAEIHTVAAGDIDLSSASGRMIARMLGAAAQHESERIGERIMAKNEELAASGAAPGGRPPYGYRRAVEVGDNGRITKNYAIAEDEAAAIRKMAQRVLEGASLLAISKELDAAGIRTREGRDWHHSTVRSVLTNPAVAGLRVHHREPRYDGKPSRVAMVAGPGNWPPILDRATWEQVRATIADPARKRTRPARKHLLSGLVINELGEKMNGSVNAVGNPIYVTRVPAVKSTQVPAEKLEAVIQEAVLLRFDETVLPPADARSGDNSVGEEIVRLEAELKQLAELRGAGTITFAEWLAARGPIQERIEAARKAAGSRRRPLRNEKLLSEPGSLRKAWPGLDFATKRDIVTAVIEKITILPATRGRWTTVRERLDPETGIVWRDSVGGQ